MVLRIVAVVMAAMGGARIVRGLFHGFRIDWLGVFMISAGTLLLAVMVWLRGGDISAGTFGPAIRGAVRALLGAAF